jgi:putative aminopeptidase
MNQIQEMLKTFMLLPAPSGYEKEMAYAMKAALEPYADDICLDQAGNVIARIQGTDSMSPRVMVFAHMDQLGFMTRKIEADGFIQVDRLGGIPEKVLPGLKLAVRARDGQYHPAVVGTKSHHAMPAEEKMIVDPITSLSIDLGVNSDRQVRSLGIEIGSPAVFEPSFGVLQDSRICGTSVDNRGGCASLVRTAGLLRLNRPKSDVYLVGTVWEEFNLRGAMLAARSVQPAIAFCLDVVLAGDSPDLKSRYEARLGAGPAINHYTFHGRGTINGTIPHAGLVDLAVRAAAEEKLAIQHFAALGIITDSAYLQLEGKGTAVLDLGFAARYTHSPLEVCDSMDLENLSRLTWAAVSRIDRGFSLFRY